ncbi:MAG: peptidase C1 [Bacteroidetes bacterium]|nr:peptidase C1 [Bacteroidota bacterium]
MPVRMEQDEDNAPQDDNDNNGGGGGGGGFPGGGLIWMFLPLLMRNPKLLVVVLILGGIFYFRGGCNLAPSTSSQKNGFGVGAALSPKEFDKAEVFAALSDKEKLPESVSLLKYAPDRQNQGSQGSCVGWGSAYAARTILQSTATGEDPNQIAFSPSFLYNQIKLNNDCEGSYIQRAAEYMQQKGALPFDKFGYSDRDCSKRPEPSQMQEANQFKINGYNRLTLGGDDQTIDMKAIRQNLAKGAPVIIGMAVGGTFMQEMIGKKIWHPTEDDYSKQGFGGHCMCVIGYDDYMEGGRGGFQLMNSWGPEWGDNGIAWISYKDFKYFCVEAYGLDPLVARSNADSDKLNVSIGLISKDLKNYFALERNSADGNTGVETFRTSRVLAKKTKFKIEVTNSIACYTYVLGKDTDQSSYVLFPYTEKHSAYCGITGTRVFPRDYSMVLDEIGTQDYITIIISKEPIDIKSMNKVINSNNTGDYRQRVQSALRTLLIPNVHFTGANGKIAFETTVKEKNAVAVVIELQKQ